MDPTLGTLTAAGLKNRARRQTSTFIYKPFYKKWCDWFTYEWSPQDLWFWPRLPATVLLSRLPPVLQKAHRPAAIFPSVPLTTRKRTAFVKMCNIQKNILWGTLYPIMHSFNLLWTNVTWYKSNHCYFFNSLILSDFYQMSLLLTIGSKMWNNYFYFFFVSEWSVIQCCYWKWHVI